MSSKLIVLSILAITLFGCGPKALSEAELAQIQLDNAERCFNDSQINAAKLHIDSINELYVKQIDIRKKAALIFTKIQLIETKRNLVFADSVIIIKQHEFDSIVKKFRFEKDEKYEDVGNYIYKRQRTEDIAGNTYIKPLVEENGLFILSSICCTEYPIKHLSAKFTIDGLFAETETVPVSSGYNYSFKDNDLTYETVIYRSNENEVIARQIQDNIDKQIKVNLIGEKSKKTFILSPIEKKAISEAYNLSVVLKDLLNLKRIINTSKKKIILFETEIEQQ